jgi:putative aminopeptidase FrvX
VEKNRLNRLKDLMGHAGPTGFEGPVQAWFKKQYTELELEAKTDILGNLCATLNPNGKTKVMLAGHSDEIGLMVNYINEDGFIFFVQIGGVDPTILPGLAVNIHTDTGPVTGVIGRLPYHILKESKDDHKEPKFEDLWIDIGARTREDAEKMVTVGDPITVDSPFRLLANNIAACRAFDDKIGGFIALEVARNLAGNPPANAALFCVHTVQEEVGSRGAITSAFALEPDVGIALDVGHTGDYPGIDKKKTGDNVLGGGPIIIKGSNSNPVLVKQLIETAKGNGIPFQLSAQPNRTYTDSDVIQTSRAGTATISLGLPNRYMHTPIETISLEDVDNFISLLTGWLQSIPAEADFTPFQM